MKPRRQHTPTDLKMDKKIARLRRHYLATGDLSSLLIIHNQVLKQSQATAKKLISEEHNALNSNTAIARLSGLMRHRRPQANNHIPAIVLPNGSILHQQQEICEAFAAHFATYFIVESSPSPLIPINLTSPLNDINISERDVRAELNRLKPSIHPGPDGIAPSLLKMAGQDIPFLLAHLYSLSFASLSHITNQAPAPKSAVIVLLITPLSSPGLWSASSNAT